MHVINIVTNFTYKLKDFGGENPTQYKEITIGIMHEIAEII